MTGIHSSDAGLVRGGVARTRAANDAVHGPEFCRYAVAPIPWTSQLYPQSKPQGTDEAKLLADSRRVFMSRFADYELHDTRKYGESLAKRWTTSPG